MDSIISRVTTLYAILQIEKSCRYQRYHRKSEQLMCWGKNWCKFLHCFTPLTIRLFHIEPGFTVIYYQYHSCPRSLWLILIHGDGYRFGSLSRGIPLGFVNGYRTLYNEEIFKLHTNRDGFPPQKTIVSILGRGPFPTQGSQSASMSVNESLVVK